VQREARRRPSVAAARTKTKSDELRATIAHVLERVDAAK
jgi:hypothetical protein